MNKATLTETLEFLQGQEPDKNISIFKDRLYYGSRGFGSLVKTRDIESACLRWLIENQDKEIRNVYVKGHKYDNLFVLDFIRNARLSIDNIIALSLSMDENND